MNALIEAEKRYLDILYKYIRNIFVLSPLPSHDHLHHMRVWYFAKLLMKYLTNSKIHISSGDSENLILAIMFHDTGLTKTLKEDHGIESRKICQQFISDYPTLFGHDLNDAFLAIENHDDKSYSSAASTNKISIHGILSVCDDADAYGITGILRYAEIYLLRGITEEDLPGKVLTNLEGRFRYFRSLPWIPEQFYNMHLQRYELTRKFFQEIIDNPESEGSSAARKIIKLYMEKVNSGLSDIPQFASYLSASADKYQNKFGALLRRELEQFSKISH